MTNPHVLEKARGWGSARAGTSISGLELEHLPEYQTVHRGDVWVVYSIGGDHEMFGIHIVHKYEKNSSKCISINESPWRYPKACEL
jgi:hypothetical protein